jgi:hypothetical protein
MSDEFLTQDEVTQIVLMTVRGMGRPTEDDMEKAVEWAKGVRIDAALLRLVLDGKLAIKAVEPEMTFKAADQ